MNSAGIVSSAGPQQASAACPQCGSTSRVGRGLCLKCLLYRGLGAETYEADSLENALDETDVRDADWRLGNYQILEEIGRGGMGVIYRARQRHSRRIVALKRILTHHADSQDTLIRFRREAEAAASLDHPNILPIYEVSEGEDGLPFFSMKFAAGGNLLQHQPELHGRARRVVELVAKVSRAVEYAHSRGILHRDLKPGNILLDGRGEPLVSDFGLAKWLDASSDLTRTLTVFGTPGYIAPEQANGPASSLRPSADIYSLGAILFDLLAGRPPFLGEHALSVIQQAIQKPAPKLRSISHGVDRDLETICAHCLEREPNARYSSSGALAEDLERWLDGRPVVARPVSAPVRVWRWTRRNPKLAASVAGCALAGVTALAFVTFTFLPDTSPFRPLVTLSDKSIAVLPFENRSDDKENVYFTDGVQDEILNNLSKVADLKVISRTSVIQYPSGGARNLHDIARTLGVVHLVEGSVQRIGNRVRVSAQLVDTRTNAHIWGEHYDRDVADVFGLESELAQQIVSRLKAKLSPQEKAAIEEAPTTDLFAYELYERAQHLIDAISMRPQAKDDLIEAVQLLDRAIARDPAFLRAYCALARAHDSLYSIGFDHTLARLELARKAVDAALKLRPDSGEGHLALAQHLVSGYRDYESARVELEIARRQLPNEPLIFRLAGNIDRRQGRSEQAILKLKRAAELDPHNTTILEQLCFAFGASRRFGEAQQVIDRILSIAPDNTNAKITRAYIDFQWQANPKPLRETIQAILSANPDAAPTISAVWMYLALSERDSAAAENALSHLPKDGCDYSQIPFPHSWCEGLVARLRGDNAAAQKAFLQARVEAETILRQQPDYPEALCALGLIDAALGKKGDAIKEGRRAVELCPITKDAIEGALMIQYLAMIYTWTGEKDLALQQLEVSARIPNGLSYGELRMDPYWDSLRGDSRFDKIVSSLAPRAAQN